jgi:hypothetical protein
LHPEAERIPLRVDPLVGMTRLTKALMDGGNGLNLMYLNTFEGSGLGRHLLKTKPHPFCGVVLVKQSIHHEQINLPITFRDASNYRIETLAFEVAEFPSLYHVILGQPSYTKFMAIPNYAYLKVNIPGPTNIIIMEAMAQRALDYE